MPCQVVLEAPDGGAKAQEGTVVLVEVVLEVHVVLVRKTDTVVLAKAELKVPVVLVKQVLASEMQMKQNVEVVLVRLVQEVPVVLEKEVLGSLWCW